jgi:glycogen operon protein
VGNFPVLWAEWNGKYRDAVRRFWRGDAGQVGELAYRLTGSSDLYAASGRRPSASINFVTCHDGFTLRDLVSYNVKHNEANGEQNRDGTDDNISSNGGVEGETDSAEIRQLRWRRIRSFIATLMVSQGVPMILHGDEVARTQRGNNNAYCQDNETAWMPWDLSEEQRQMLEWTRRLVRFRRDHAVLRRRHYFLGRAIRGAGVKDVVWLRPDGKEMSDADWTSVEGHCLGIHLAGAAADLHDNQYQPIVDDTLLILMNSQDTAVEFKLPGGLGQERWWLALDTSRPEVDEGLEDHAGGEVFQLSARSLGVFTHPTL